MADSREPTSIFGQISKKAELSGSDLAENATAPDSDPESRDAVGAESARFAVDSESIPDRTGNFLFTVGTVGSGKSTLQNCFVHHLWTDPNVEVSWNSADGDTRHDTELNSWIHRFDSGRLPPRTTQGLLQEFNISINQSNRPALELNFFEISGEDIRRIVPTEQNSVPSLPVDLEAFLKLANCNKRFLFVTDSTKNRMRAKTDDTRKEEDVLFSSLLKYLLNEDGIGLKKIRALLVAAKWDAVKSEYKSSREYFLRNFPNTIATVKNSKNRVDAQFRAFTVGEMDTVEEDGVTVSRIRSLDRIYIRRVINWVYDSFTNRSLHSYPSVRDSLWDKVRFFFAR